MNKSYKNIKLEMIQQIKVMINDRIRTKEKSRLINVNDDKILIEISELYDVRELLDEIEMLYITKYLGDKNVK